MEKKESLPSSDQDELPPSYTTLEDSLGGKGAAGPWVHQKDTEMTIVFAQPPHLVHATEPIDTATSSESDLFRSFRDVSRNVGTFIEENKRTIRWGLLGLASILYVGYFIWAVVVSSKFKCQDVWPLIGLTIVVVTCVVITLLRKHYKEKLERMSTKFSSRMRGRPAQVIKVCVAVLALLGVVGVLISTIWQTPSNAVALGGMAFFIIVLWIFSAFPSKVNWRPVAGGLLLQFYFALIILRWDTGYQAFMWMGQRIQTFLSFSDYGAKFVFGDKYMDHFFAMKVLPVVVFFSCAINVLYYIGAMQAVIGKIGWVLRQVLGTTAPESVCAAANIFIGQSEAPIMIRPFLGLMTKSELNAVMTGGFATIAGGVMAAYISFGVPPEHLLCASVMNAPCALAVAKILYPETEESQIKKVSDVDIGETTERNVLEAAAAGASQSIKLVANIAANLIAFLAMLAFINAMLSWFGSFICYPDLTFQMICGYVFMPVAYLMGVDWKDAGVVGELLGIKTFLNEFVAYGELAEFMKNRADCAGPMISVRSQLITTYALCGFANLSAIGITLGGLSPMAPSRRGDLAEMVMRSLLGGIITSLITASVAGLLLVNPAADLCADMTLNSTVTMATELNSTMATNLTYLVNATGSSIL